jgi:hypothetical protein
MRALMLCSLIGVVVGAALFACNPNSIGRPCVNPGGEAVAGTQVSSPALECPSRLCLITAPGTASGNVTGVDGGFRAACTAECQHDSDCDPETKEQCKSGFSCAVAVETGRFCCKKFCICKEDLEVNKNIDLDGGTIIPASCKPGSGSACINLKK